MHIKNKTRYKTLDLVARDFRVEEIWEESWNDIWVSLKEGYICGENKTSCLHVFETKAPVKETIWAWKGIIAISEDMFKQAQEEQRKTIQKNRKCIEQYCD